MSALRKANIARDKEWDPEGRLSLLFFGVALAGETGEACNIIKKLAREQCDIRGSRATLEQLAKELADIVIYADLLAIRASIDLDRAVRDKFNATSAKYGLMTRIET
jgi:NTP pyrophosphatase (non-canonical NTP hydrolase)